MQFPDYTNHRQIEEKKHLSHDKTTQVWQNSSSIRDSFDINNQKTLWKKTRQMSPQDFQPYIFHYLEPLNRIWGGKIQFWEDDFWIFWPILSIWDVTGKTDHEWKTMRASFNLLNHKHWISKLANFKIYALLVADHS